jgi:hypothetical protein
VVGVLRRPTLRYTNKTDLPDILLYPQVTKRFIIRLDDGIYIYQAFLRLSPQKSLKSVSKSMFDDSIRYYWISVDMYH